MKFLPCLVVGSALLLSALAGCGSDVDGVFGSNDGSGGAGTGGRPATSGETVGKTSGSNQTTGGQTTGQVSASVSTAATTVASTTTGMVPVTVACRGAGDCPIDGDAVCCWDDEAEAGQCMASGEMCQSPRPTEVLTAINCQLPEHCEMGVCCAHRAIETASSAYDSTFCTNQCEYPHLWICDPAAPACPMGATCKASTLLPPGYYVCGFN